MRNTKAHRILHARVPEQDTRFGDRLPPGQVLTDRFPILHEGNVPTYDLDAWTLRVFGEVEAETVFKFRDILALPQDEVVADIHCVTRWSKFDTVWEGVVFRRFCEEFHVKPEAQFVMLHGDYDYTTVAPLEDLLRPNVVLAHSYNGAPLTDKHGWPLRLVVPHLYFWKSIKWLRGIEFLREYKDGFWEERDFHSYGDPFQEQRFSKNEFLMKIDGWKRKDYD